MAKQDLSAISDVPKPRMDGPGTFAEHALHESIVEQRKTNALQRELLEQVRDFRSIPQFLVDIRRNTSEMVVLMRAQNEATTKLTALVQELLDEQVMARKARSNGHAEEE